MNNPMIEKRSTKRFDYLNRTVVLVDNQKEKGEILSIGPTGVFFQFPHELPDKKIVRLGWRDFEFGIIKGEFKIRVRKKSDQAWQYHARFKRLEEPSKTHALELLKHLNTSYKVSKSIQSDPFAAQVETQEQTIKEYQLTQGLIVEDVQHVVSMDAMIFQNFKEGKANLCNAADALLSCIEEEDLKMYISPKTALEHSLMRLKMFFIQASLFVQYLEEKENIAFSDLRYCVNQISYLMDEIATLEKNAGFAEPSNPARIDGEEVSQEKLRDQAHYRKIIVLSNKTYDCLFKLRNFFKNNKWFDKNQGLDQSQVQILQAGSNIIIQKFKEKFEVSYDEETYKELGHEEFYGQNPKVTSQNKHNRFVKKQDEKKGLSSFFGKIFSS